MNIFLKNIAVIILIVFPVLTPLSMVSAQLAPGGEFLGSPRTIRYDTRSLSMAGATISDLSVYTSMGVNPAIMGLRANNKAFHINGFNNWNTNINQIDLHTPALRVGRHFAALRLGYTQTGFNDVNPLGSASLPEPEFSSYTADLGYAFKVSDDFSIGTMHSVSLTESTDAQYFTYFFDLGMIYDPEGPITYSMVFKGIGREANYEIIETGQTTLGSDLLRQSLEIGATLEFPVEGRRPFLNISLSNEKLFGTEGVFYKGGLEITPIPQIALRSGLMLQTNDSILIPRYGVGININLVRLHYMIAPKNLDTEYYHQLGLTIQL